jgi:hypothetical protein
VPHFVSAHLSLRTLGRCLTGLAAGLSLSLAGAQIAESPGGLAAAPSRSARHEALRALAAHLDATARGALACATDGVEHDMPGEAGFLAPVRAFAEDARAFRLLIDTAAEVPAESRSRLQDLTERASRVGSHLRSQHVLENTYDHWAAILDDLELLRRTLAGEQVPAPGPYVTIALSGLRLREFRRLADDVDAQASLMHDRARRHEGDYPVRGRQFVGELNYLAARSRALREEANAGPVLPEGISLSVERLLVEARESDRSLRDADVFTAVWPESGRTITALRRMARLARTCGAPAPPSEAARP